ncbi:MAG: hypothetical protein HY537_09825 [Deltaproteobacteria bacterium]|nr:hypothetical protein [Deltaproteobacteria bacterium]
MKFEKHYGRLLGVLIGVAACFVYARSILVPKDFGKLGHFRASAIDEIKALPVQHVGADKCKDCHNYEYEQWSGPKSLHKQKVKCEACHGPGGHHIAKMNGEPIEEDPRRDLKVPDSMVVCSRCHLKLTGRPEGQPMLADLNKHMTEPDGTKKEKCVSCHNPHTQSVYP